MKLTKIEALAKIEELKQFIQSQENEEWVTIDYSKIPKEVFDKYGAKPFKIMKKKMRDSKGEVLNNITWKNAKTEAQKLGYRLLAIQEILVLLHVYKEKYPDNADINHDEFLGIEELAYKHDVCYEWIDAPCPCARGGSWSYGSNAGVFATTLGWDTGTTSYYVGFRCASDL